MSSTLGVIYGNRDIFPDHLVPEARQEVGGILKKLGIHAVSLEEEQSKLEGRLEQQLRRRPQ